MKWYENWEYYNFGTDKQRFVSLGYVHKEHLGKPLLIYGHLPRSHGFSYKYAREQLQELGETMGLDLLTQSNKTYTELVEETKNL